MSKKKNKIGPHAELFDELKRGIQHFDPVSFTDNHLLLESGDRFNLSAPEWKYMADMYRFIALQVDNKDALPIVTLKGRQVGATMMARNISLFFTSSGLFGKEANKPPMRVLHLFPTLGLLSMYTKDKLDVGIRSSIDNYVSKRALKNDPELRGNSAPEDTYGEKSFIGNSKLRVDSIGKDADRIRGLSQDVMFCDEVQDMSRQAIDNAKRILQHSKYGSKGDGIQLFFGTPKQSGSYFWEMWDNSDQRFYQLRCENCDDYFFLYNLEDESWRDIWVKDNEVRCPTCAFHQDKGEAIGRGRWIPTEVDGTGKRVPAPNRKEKYVGFHHNLMLTPLFDKRYVENLSPKDNPLASERAWKNEVLGDFYRGGGTPLTMEDIIANALDDTRGVAKSVSNEGGKTFLLGMDWGDKDEGDETKGTKRGQSYTTAVALSVDKDGTFTVENAFRLKKNDIMYKVNVIEKVFANYKIHTACTDYMWGQETVRYMQKDLEYGSRFLGCINSGNINKLYSYDEKYLRITVNKDQMIDEIFGLIRRGKIKFPSKGWAFEQLRWLLEHCTSMETKLTKKNENTVKKYIKGSQPNDGLMALMYAVLAYKFVETGGFKEVGGKAKEKASGMPKPIVGYVPKLR